MSKAPKGAIRPNAATLAPALANADAGALSTAQTESVSTEQVQAMTTDEIKVLSTNALAALATAGVAALETHDVAALTTDQIAMLPDWIKYAKPPAPDATVVMPGFTSVKYIGKRPEYVEGAYGTRLLFKQGESRWVPNDAAKKMLKHKDVYVLGDVPTMEPVKVAPKQHQKEEEELQDLRDSIASMDKVSMAKFAKIHYGQDLDTNMTVADTRRQLTMLVDQYGIA